MSTPPLQVVDLGYTFAGRTVPSLAEIDFTLEPGTWTLLAGRTGSGKSTLLRALAGLIPHHTAGTMRGRVELDGRDTRHITRAELARTVGIVFQSPDDQICSTTVAAEVAFGLENLSVDEAEIGERVAAALARVGLAQFRDARTAHLSGGQKQRLLLASILAMEPQIVLLDEPLSQLDRATAGELLQTLDDLRQAGLTLVTAEHRLDEIIDHADRLLVIDEGLLVADLDPRDVARVHAALAQHDLDPPELYELAVRSGQSLHALFSHAGDIPSSPAGEEPTASGPSHSVTKRNSPSRLLSVEQLTHRFSRRAEPIWNSLSFAIRSGQRVALVGPNGSGKSTLLSVLAGVMRPSEGKVDAPAIDRDRAAIGLVLQNPDLMLFSATVCEELAFGPRQLGLDPGEVDRRVANAAGALDLVDMLDEPPMALSQGERLRTAVAATLTLAPRVLLLDEPTTGQDLRQVERVMQAITAALQGPAPVGAVLFATHDLRSVARYADRVLVLTGGQLLADCTPEEFIARDELLRQARLLRTPLLELRRQRGLLGWTPAELAQELRA
ncbi:MAG: ATP-binding cassette domain-containing protein [Pirellulales bacterium]|nr:ATP-binding cassette domain-containing protein [Pirellulales bacterium]